MTLLGFCITHASFASTPTFAAKSNRVKMLLNGGGVSGGEGKRRIYFLAAECVW